MRKNIFMVAVACILVIVLVGCVAGEITDPIYVDDLYPNTDGAGVIGTTSLQFDKIYSKNGFFKNGVEVGLEPVPITKLYKSQDESVTSSTVLQHDDTFQFSVLSGYIYWIEIWYITHCHTSGDFRTGVSDSSANITSKLFGSISSSPTVGTPEGSYQTFNYATDTLQWNYLQIWSDCSADGTVYMDWCQNASYAQASIIKAGSWATVTVIGKS